MRSWAIILGLVLGSGCAVVRSYHLPVDGAALRQTFPAIRSVASDMSFEADESPEGVEVRVDDAVRIEFRLDGTMVVHLDHHGVPPDEVDRALLLGRATGDEIWKRALASMRVREGEL